MSKTGSLAGLKEAEHANLTKLSQQQSFYHVNEVSFFNQENNFLLYIRIKTTFLSPCL